MIWGFDPYKELVKASDRVERAYNLLVGASMIESPENVSFEVKALIGPMLKAMSRRRDKAKLVFGLRVRAFKELSKGIKSIEKILRKGGEEVSDVRHVLEEVLGELRDIVDKGYFDGVEEKLRSIADKMHRVEDVLWRKGK